MIVSAATRRIHRPQPTRNTRQAMHKLGEPTAVIRCRQVGWPGQCDVTRSGGRLGSARRRQPSSHTLSPPCFIPLRPNAAHPTLELQPPHLLPKKQNTPGRPPPGQGAGRAGAPRLRRRVRRGGARRDSGHEGPPAAAAKGRRRRERVVVRRGLGTRGALGVACQHVKGAGTAISQRCDAADCSTN